MFPHVIYLRFIFLVLLLPYCHGSELLESTQDQTSIRANTLLDDADDIQRQLDNEARDRIKYGRPKTIWVFHLPTQFPVTRHVRDVNWLRHLGKKINKRKPFTITLKERTSKEWNYKDQNKWSKSYPDCGGRSQSPVDLPYRGLVDARGARKLVLKNYNVAPENMKLVNDKKSLTLYGEWPKQKWPYIFGGAAHSRRYVFYSLTIHWPSEHTVAGLQYPVEAQAMHVAAEHKTMERALQAAVSDPMAILMVTTLYRYANFTQRGIGDMIKVASVQKKSNDEVQMPMKPLSHFIPPFSEYVCYQGSLTTPPCTEAVMWVMRGRMLPISRDTVEEAHKLLGQHNIRTVEPMNDRKAYYFNDNN